MWDALNELMNHPSAEQIYESIIEKYPTISRATVYRNLNSSWKMENPAGASHRHPTTMIGCSTSTFISNVVCKSVHDIEVAKDLSVELENLDLKGYRLESYQVVFNGVCPDCQKE